MRANMPGCRACERVPKETMNKQILTGRCLKSVSFFSSKRLFVNLSITTRLLCLKPLQAERCVYSAGEHIYCIYIDLCKVRFYVSDFCVKAFSVYVCL